jgi:hypothetical protein
MCKAITAALRLMTVSSVKENDVITTFEKRKLILKCYWKMKNVTEVLRRWRNEFGAGGGHFEHL